MVCPSPWKVPIVLYVRYSKGIKEKKEQHELRLINVIKQRLNTVSGLLHSTFNTFWTSAVDEDGLDEPSEMHFAFSARS